MTLLLGSSSANTPSSFDWLTGVVIPVVLGGASILIAVVALIAAISANRVANLALNVSRNAANREAQMPRERVAHAAILSLNGALHSPWTDDEDFTLRVIPTMGVLVQKAGEEGVGPASVQSLVRWLAREADAVGSNTTGDHRKFYDLPSRQMGMLALRMSFGLRVEEWVQTEKITEIATVSDEQADIMKPLQKP